MRKEKIKELEKLMDKYKTIEVINEKEVSSGFLKIIEADYKLNNGKTINRDRYLKNNLDGNCCIILPISKNKEVTLVVQPRVQTKRTVAIECPAGLIDKDEEIINAAKRELLEETGCTCEKLIPLVKEAYQDPSSSRGKTNIFLALNTTKIQEQSLDEDEYISTFLCTFEEALELVELRIYL